MQTELVSYDDPLVRRLRDGGVLQDLNPSRIVSMDGMILLGCSDKNRFPDLFSHLRLTCNEERIHTFAWHGAALRLVQESPANKGNGPTFAADLLQEIYDAVAVVAKTPTVILTVHLPCGKAHLAGMHWTEVLQTLFVAKQRLRGFIRAEQREVVIHPVVHIHYKDAPNEKERKRSYFFGTRQWSLMYPEIRERVFSGAA